MPRDPGLFTFKPSGLGREAPAKRGRIDGTICCGLYIGNRMNAEEVIEHFTKLPPDEQEKVRAWVRENYFSERAARGSREKFVAALAEAPDLPPDSHDAR